MKVSGLILTALALTYLYLWRTDGLKVVTPALAGAAPPAHQTTEQRFAQAAP